MRYALILHNPVNGSSKADELDVLDQVGLVEGALGKLGYGTQRFAYDPTNCGLFDLVNSRPLAIVFNLVETVNGSGRLSFIVPAQLELFGVPFTGSGTGAIFMTTDKVMCKTLLCSHKIVTPVWATDMAGLDPQKSYIIKPIAEDGSVGIDDAALFLGSEIKVLPTGHFAEEYVHGREFNISVIGGKKDFEVLPPAEMCFSSGYYETKPRILGYKAKWDETSFEYQNTKRSFRFKNTDTGLLLKLKEVAEKCWEIFGLSGYARVDLRVGNDNIPQVIEINANPCIAPDSGFVAACEEAGMDKIEIIKRIIDEAII